MKQFLFIAIASLALLSSCQRVPSISAVTPQVVDNVPASGGTVGVKVSSDGEWAASAEMEDIIIEPSSGSGDNVPVSIKVPANNTDSTRSVKVTFYSVLGTSSIDVIIHQVATSISVEPKNTTISALGGEINFTVTAEGEWTVSAGSGVTVEPSSGSGNAPVKLTVPVNSGDERDVKVIFCSALNSSVADTATIHQDSMSLSVTPKDTTVAASGGQVEFTVMADGEWKTLADNGSTVTPSSGSGNGSVKVTVPANTTGTDRNVTVQVYSTQNTSLSRSVTIHQKSISISVTPSTGTVSASGGQVGFTVTADGAWRASADNGAEAYPATWSDLGERTVQVTVPANTTGLKREVTVKFWLKANTSIFRTVTISQESIAITVSPQTAEVSASGGAFDVTVTSDGAWKTSVGDWKDSEGKKITTADKVNLSSSAGSGNASVKVNVPANATGQERYVKVEFFSTLNSSICKTVTIHQKVLSISVAPDEFNDVPAAGDTVKVTVKSDGDWGAHSILNGNSPSPSSGSSGESEVSIIVPKNTTDKDRDVKIKFYLTSHSTTVCDTVIFHQKAPSISVTEPTDSVLAAGGTVTVQVTSDGGWSASADNSATVSPANQKGLGNKVPVSIMIPNNSGKKRDVKVTFTSSLNGNVKQTVTIHQKGK